MVDEALRKMWTEECPGFGYDNDLGTGLDLTTEECKRCQESSSIRFAACKAEVDEAKEQPTPAPLNDREEGVVDAEAMPPQSVTMVQEPAPTVVDLKVPKTPKIKKAKSSSGVPAAVAKVLRAGTQKTREDIVEAVCEDTHVARVYCGLVVSHALAVGVEMGWVKQDGKQFLVV